MIDSESFALAQDERWEKVSPLVVSLSNHERAAEVEDFSSRRGFVVNSGEMALAFTPNSDSV